MDDIKEMLRRAGLLDKISYIRSAAPDSPEGILFDINDRQSFVGTIKGTRKFTKDIPTEHLGQVGGNAFNTKGFRSYTDSIDSFGPDSTGFRRSLQIAGRTS